MAPTITTGNVPVISISASCLPERYKKMYNITDEETDLGDFK